MQHTDQRMPLPAAETADAQQQSVSLNELSQESAAKADDKVSSGVTQPREIGGREGPEPTRFGDWERAGRCIDF